MKFLNKQLFIVIVTILIGVAFPILAKKFWGFYKTEDFFALWCTLWGTFIGATLALEIWLVQYNYQEKIKARNKAILSCVLCRDSLIEVFPKLDDDSVDIRDSKMQNIIEQSVKTLRINLYTAIIPIFKVDNLNESKKFLELLQDCSMVILFLNSKDKNLLRKYMNEFFKHLEYIQKEFGAEYTL